MTTSVLIVSHNVRELLRRCLASIPEKAEVVVVDNGSGDGSAAMVAEEFPRVELIADDRNRGFSAGVNRAAAVARGDLLLLLNPDAELPAGSLEAMQRSLGEHSGAGALGVRQVDGEGFFQLATGPEPTLLKELGRKWVQGRLDRRDSRVAAWLDRFQARPRRVAWAAASCLLVRRPAFEAVGGFDEGFFLFFEDLDFCLRLRQAGWVILHDPRITVIHQRGASAASAPTESRRAYRESQLRFWRRHRSRASLAFLRFYLKLRGELP